MRFEKETIHFWVLERFTGMWTPEGQEWDDLEEAKKELEFNRKLFPQEKFRLVKKSATVIWRKR